jgi:hypothetical protein
VRTISAASLAKLATRLATEPINIIEIQWVSGGSYAPYADRTITGIAGKIQSIGELDDVINVSGSGQSQSLDVVLDDTDGSIKAILDTHDIHKRPCRVYQWFDGLALTEKFLVFQGLISSPITWNEGDRTVSFTIVSKLEDREIGFSAEEGAFDTIPEKLVGTPWPMIFGTALDVPAVSFADPLTGITTSAVSIHDFTIEMQLDVLAVQRLYSLIISNIFRDLAEYAEENGDTNAATDYYQREAEAGQRTGELMLESIELQAELDDQLAQELPTVIVVGGEKFPQDTELTLNIDGGLFTGYFETSENEEDEEITSFHIVSRQHPDYGMTNTPHIDLVIAIRYPTEGPRELYGYREEVTGDSASFFTAGAGTQVRLAEDEPVDHVVSMVPGTVLNVKAKRAFEGIKQLMTVPADYYTIRTETYGSIEAVMLRLDKPLSSYEDEGWDDDLYVTFESEIGPNVVDILEYLIGLYLPEMATDNTSFAHVKAHLTDYPANFAIMDRRNIVEVLEEIAHQSRCAIWLNGDTFFLRYLPEEPTPTLTISQTDIVPKSMEVFHTDTEDLVTKLVAEWRESYAADEPNKVILKHNVNKYGTQEETEEYYIYNSQDLVIKSATFWLIRMANTWKKMRFKTFLHKLQLETLDPVTLDFTETYVSTAACTGIIEQANYDSESHEIQFEIWTPIKAGTMVPYNFAWPADVSQSLLFPTVQEEAAGNAGGDGVGSDADGDLASGTITEILPGYRSHQDYGDPHPSDAGDTAPPLPKLADKNTFDNTKPTNQTPAYQKHPYEPGTATVPAMSVIDIRNTVIKDSTTGEEATLATFFKQIKNAKLQMSTDAILSDGTNDAAFDFEYDAETLKYGAGTAFLQDLV